MPDAPPPTGPSDLPLVAAIEMGYGHMRPAHALADALGTRVLQVDGPELAGADEQRLWRRIRGAYEGATRLSTVPGVGAPFRWLVDSLTGIHPLHPHRDQSRPDLAVRRLERAFRAGLGGRLVEVLKESGRPLLTTWFVPALAAARAGCERVSCVVTDSDIHRVWAPLEPARTGIRYLVPARRTLRRLRAYGVPRENVHVTGYPLPGALLGGEHLPALTRALARRLVRLDPEGRFRAELGEDVARFLGPLPEDDETARPPLVTFAVGGAGAQVAVVERALPSLRRELEAGRLRLALVAGVRGEVAARFDALLARERLADRVEVLLAPDLATYLARFDALIARTDVLWTKPSELTFFGALGLCLLLSSPVGVHERYNRRWAREQGAAIKQRDPRYAGQWLREALEDGLLAAAAWSGYTRLPKSGLYRIARLASDPQP